MRSVKIVLADERPVSWNKYYSGMHWSDRQAEAQRVHLTVRANLDPETAVFTKPVDITITAYFKNRPLDASNITAKLYEDGLVGWLIEDDSPKYVRSMTTRSRIDKKNPRVEIELMETSA